MTSLHWAVRRVVGSIVLLALVPLLSCSAPRQPPLDDDPGVIVDMSMPPFDAPSCIGLACFVANCAGGTETVVSGRVTAPNGRDPIREALVYVPESGAAEEFPPKVSCEVCNSPVGGRPVAITTTDVDGSFELRRVPVTRSTPIVIQKGRWRKVINLNVGRCEQQGLTAEETRLPKDRSEGILPRMAVAIGEWDAIECVLRKIGVQDTEFSGPGTSSSIHLYDNAKPGGAGAPGGANIGSLVRDLNRMLEYNIIFLNCSDVDYAQSLLSDPAVIKNLAEYVRRGGRLYVTDWSYNFIQQVPEFSPFICFNDDKPCTVTTPHGFHQATGVGRTGSQTTFYADINQRFAGGKALAQWVGYLPTPIRGGRVRIDDPVASYVLIRQLAQDQTRHPATTWLSADLASAVRPVTVSFDYPPGEAACGRVLYSTYHTREHEDHSAPFPRYCPAGSMTGQEHVLEYLIFELGSCIQPPG